MTDDPQRLILVLRLAVKMREKQKEHRSDPKSASKFSAMVKAEREFDIAAEAALR